MKDRSVVFSLYMPDCGELGVIQVWVKGSNSWTEFRGLPYSKSDDEDSPFNTVLNALEGQHATVLFQDSILDVGEFCSGNSYANIKQIMEKELDRKFT